MGAQGSHILVNQIITHATGRHFKALLAVVLNIVLPATPDNPTRKNERISKIADLSVRIMGMVLVLGLLSCLLIFFLGQEGNFTSSMDKGTITDVLGGLFAATFALSWIVHFLGYYFLEMIYNKDPFPIVIPGFDWFSPYNKSVKPKHEWIKRVTDFTLKAIGIHIALGFLFALLVFFFTAGK